MTPATAPPASFAIVPDFIANDNYRPGRGGWWPDVLVIHVTEGSASSAREWFHDTTSDVSAHFLVSRRGEIRQFVRIGDSAFANGERVNPTARIVRERADVNPNRYTVSVECEGDGTTELTDTQRAALYWLTMTVILPACPQMFVDRDHIIGHHEIKASKSCPGAISVDRIVRDLRALADGGAPDTPDTPPPVLAPRVVWSPYFAKQHGGVGWLVVTRVASNDEWYFVPLVAVVQGLQETRAATPLSQMPSGPT